MKKTNMLASYTHPIMIGGLGGSGTRLIAQCLNDLGFFMGHDLNNANDNLWFTLLFKRTEILTASEEEFNELVEILFKGMTGSSEFTNEQIDLINGLASTDRKQHPTTWLRERAYTLLSKKPKMQTDIKWGWKEPNSHVVLDRMRKRFRNMKYIHVVRNGLDMAHSHNQNQLKLWGRHFMGGAFNISPYYSLKYWCITHRRVLDIGKSMGSDFLFLNYDDFCFNPEKGITELCEFLGLDSASMPGDFLGNFLSDQLDPHSSIGRFKRHGIKIFDEEDVAYVNELGFDVGEPVAVHSALKARHYAAGMTALSENMAEGDEQLQKPLLSVIVNFYNMRREAKRVLLSLSTGYQQNISEKEYEIIAIDNGSSEPLDEKEVTNYGKNFRYYYHETDSISPVGAIKAAGKRARGRFITVCIDGARILSPGILHYTAKATKLFRNPVVTVLSWHLGKKLQNESILEGYNQAAEDEMLRKINWEEDGYRLFDISCLAGSCRDGWFMPFDESNCITVSRQAFERLDGFDQNFQTAGGGLVNFDYFKRACELPDSDLVVLLGEGMFHQFHGGAATNVPTKRHPMPIYAKEYESLRGSPFIRPQKKANYLGCIPLNAARFLADSANHALAAVTGT